MSFFWSHKKKTGRMGEEENRRIILLVPLLGGVRGGFNTIQ